MFFDAGFNSSWTSSLLPNACLWAIMEAFVDKECWSIIIYKQNALVSGNGATGKLFVNRSVPHQDPPRVFALPDLDPLVGGMDPDTDPDPSIIIPWIILVCELNCVKKTYFLLAS
jgi:hypothetical protein